MWVEGKVALATSMIELAQPLRITLTIASRLPPVTTRQLHLIYGHDRADHRLR